MFPVVEPDCSDSGTFDNALEFLLMTGRTLQEAVMMMIPEAFGPRYHISTDKRAFYEYHSAIMEPWDGPAALAMTDGRWVCAGLDRNGLRPARFWITSDDEIIYASEAGVLDIDPEKILRKERLAPGKMILVDVETGECKVDHQIKGE